jgi:lipoprotein signal peptidase
MLHKKGPTEILIPTVLYSGAGHLTEATARLTFAIANFVALFAVWLLGWRLFHPLAGWLAAMLVLFDGYFIGFARIVQYQSVVLLCTVLAVYAMWRLVREPKGLAPWLSLAAISAATGLLSHYEGALVALPIAILWGVLYWRNRERQREVWVATAIAVAVGGAVLASFYLPYVLHPRFAATYYYLTDRRIGNSFPYNNLADVFLRTTLYSTTYYVVGMIVVTVAGMVRSFRRGLSPLWGNLLGSATVLFVAYTALRPEWFTLGSGETAKDQIGFLFLGLMVLLAVLPRTPLHERLLWIWFGAVMVLALFFTEKPRTHVYTFFIPWLLLNGILLAEGWLWLVAKVGRPVGQVLGAAAATLAALVFGVYAFWYFVSPSEVMMNYASERPAGYWVTYDEPDDKARFGFPLNNGWKAVGELYRQGVLDGYFDSSEKEAWVPAWYTRGEERCPREAEWFFEIRNLEPFSNEDFLEMEHYLRNGFEKVGKVQVAGEDKVIIYQRTGVKHDSPTASSNADLPAWQFEELAAAFDQTALAGLPLTYPSVDPPIAHPLNYNFGNLITLEGYDIGYPEPLGQGDTIRLTLYWRAQQPIPANYKVFTQAYGPDNRMVAQRDGYPVCDGRETWRWDPGELITDFYDIPVLADAPDGLYPLYAGFYLEETGDRLAVFDESGAEVGSQVKIAEFRIGVE